MERNVQPELLDQLPSDDDRALHSRRDLRRLNICMGHHRVLAKYLLRAPVPRTLVDLGCGDGSLLLNVASRVAPLLERTRVVLVDRDPVVSPRTFSELKRFTREVQVVTADVLDWLEGTERSAVDVMLANLFLHHFGPAELQRLLRAIAMRTRWFIALEPRRDAFAWGISCLVGLIGCNDVTRHDARVSVRAGFRERDLTCAWPRGGWCITERPAGWCSHLFQARGKSS